jgi:hypothetical protein
MAQDKITATHRQTNLPNESDEYLYKREELRLAEIELMRQPPVAAKIRDSQSLFDDVNEPPRSRLCRNQDRRTTHRALRKCVPSDKGFLH